MGYRPGELIQNTANYLLRLLEEHGSFDYSAIYDGTVETNDALCAELGIDEEDGEWFSAPHLVDSTVSHLAALGLVSVTYLDTVLADGEPIRQLQVILAGSISGIAHIHVEQRPSNVTALVIGRLPRIAVSGTAFGLCVGRNLQTAIPSPGTVVELVAAAAVHVGIAGKKVMEVGIGWSSRVDPVAVGPGVFAVPAGRLSKIGL